jgi:hypothetical protein
VAPPISKGARPGAQAEQVDAAAMAGAAAEPHLPQTQTRRLLQYSRPIDPAPDAAVMIDSPRAIVLTLAS